MERREERGDSGRRDGKGEKEMGREKRGGEIVIDWLRVLARPKIQRMSCKLEA